MPKYCQNLNTRGKEAECTLYERVDKDMLQRIISSTDIDETLRKQLAYYYTQIKNDSVQVKYYYSKNLENTGRLYAKGGSSLQSFKKEIRHALAKDIYYDIDMENAHPSLLLQYCKKNKISCPNLTNYVLNREKTLKQISEFHNITRDQAKKFLLKIQYLGSYTYEINGQKTKPDKEFPLVRSYKNELLHIAKTVCDIEKDIYESVMKDKEKKNKESSTLSILCQTLEKKCLDSMFEYFKGCGFEVGVLCFDGLMLKKTDKIQDIEAELIDCMIYVESNTGYFVKLVEKPMDTKLSFEIPDISFYVCNDRQAQEKLFLIEGAHKFKYCEDILYCYNENTGMFDTQIQTVHNYLIKNKQYLYTVQEKTEKLMSYGESSTLMNAVIPFIKAAAVDNEWLVRTEKSSLGYILFKNGIYNMKTGTFTKGFDPNIVFHRSTGKDYQEERDEEIIKKVMEKSFNSLFKDPKLMLACLSRALAGDLVIKKFYFCPGRTHAGKSVLIKMLSNAFGKYIGNFNAESLSVSSKMDSKDQAAKQRWTMLLRWCRILISSEANMERDIDGNIVKRLASGGDKLVARVHCGDEMPFIPQYTLFCFLNDIPEITPFDKAIEGRVEYIEFPYQFVDKEKIEKDYQKEKDYELENKIEEESFVNAFIHIIFDAYKDFLKNGMPKFDKEVKEKWSTENKQSSKIIDDIKEHFEVTKNKEDTVKSIEIHKFKPKTISRNNFQQILWEEFGIKETKDSSRFYKGIKKRTNDNFVDVNFN